MKILPSESEIIGSVETVAGSIVKDSSYRRIEYLIKNELDLMSADESGWLLLYRDPSENRLWLHMYEEGETHGGGFPTLKDVTKDVTQFLFNKK